jgi:hypothetical protein
MRIRRLSSAAASIAVAAAVVGCGLFSPDIASPPPTAKPAQSAAAAAPTDAVSDQPLGPWRRSPVALPDDLLSSAEFVCRNPDDEVVRAALADMPVAVVDARGGGLASIIFADDHAAFECRVKLEMVGGALGATILVPPSWLAPSSAPGEGAISIVSNGAIEDDAGARSVMIGRVGPGADRVVAGFDDATEVEAAQGGGWYTAWWPGLDRPGAVAAIDGRNVALASAPDPHDEVEGRATLARWWLDPAAGVPAADATAIKALVEEQKCASGRPPDGRILEPSVFYGQTGIIVTFLVRSQPGGQDCQGAGPGAFEFTLTEPLGDRKLLDGGQIPPRDASLPPK